MHHSLPRRAGQWRFGGVHGVAWAEIGHGSMGAPSNVAQGRTSRGVYRMLHTARRSPAIYVGYVDYIRV